MVDNKIFKVLGKFIKAEDPRKVTEGTLIKVHYTQPNSQDPDRVWQHGAIEDDLSDAALELLVNAKKGDMFTFHQGKNDKGFPTILGLSDAADAPAKNNSKSKSQYKNNNNGWQPQAKDDTGIAVGAAWTNAIEVLKAGLDINDVATLAEAILGKKLALEAVARANKANETPPAAKEEKKEEKKPLSRMEQLKQKAAAKPTKAKKKPEPVEEEEEDDFEDDDIPFDPDEE